MMTLTAARMAIGQQPGDLLQAEHQTAIQQRHMWGDSTASAITDIWVSERGPEDVVPTKILRVNAAEQLSGRKLIPHMSSFHRSFCISNRATANYQLHL